MSIKLILNYINEPTLKNKEALTKNIKPKDRKWFENYILKDLINKKEIKPFKQLYRISNNIKNNENTIKLKFIDNNINSNDIKIIIIFFLVIIIPTIEKKNKKNENNK